MKPPVEPATAALFGSQPRQLSAVDVTLFERGEVADWAEVRVATHVPKFEPRGQFAGTVVDPAFGKEPGGFHVSHKCSTCNYIWRRCTGHAGVYTPACGALLNPALDKHLRRVLSVLAPELPVNPPAGESGLLLAYMPTESERGRAAAEVRAAPAAERLNRLRKRNKPQVRGSRENRMKRGVEWSVSFTDGSVTAAEWSDAHPDGRRLQLTGDGVHALLAALTPLDIETLGVDGGVGDLTGLVFKDLPVMSTVFRLTTIREGRPCVHAYTNFYNKLVSLCDKAAALPPAEEAPPSARRSLSDPRAMAAMTMAMLLWPAALGRRKPSAAALKRMEHATKSVGDSFGKKKGAMRGEVMGKRALNCARSNITPDCHLAEDEVGVPDFIADTLVVAMPVNPVTRARAAAVAERKDVYRAMTEQHVPRLMLAGEAPPQEDGDIVLRPLEDGDIVLLNRQPTMTNQNMMGVRVRRMPGRTLRLPVDMAAPYHADFDGDEMNLYPPETQETAQEIAELAGCENGLLAFGTNKPAVGCHQDSLLGQHLLTRPGTRLNRREMLRLMSAIKECALPPSTAPEPGMWRGADALTPVLAALPPDVWWEGAGGVSVRGGRLHGGPLQKSHVGGAELGLVHYVTKQVSGRAALDMMHRLGLLAHQYLLFNPLSMNADDMTMGADAPPRPPADELLRLYGAAEAEDEALEVCNYMAVEALARRVAVPLRAGATNAFVCLVSEAGSKGSVPNLYQQFGAVGQQTVGGRRASTVSCGRTLPVYPAHTDTPESRGLVLRSLMDGLDPAGSFFHTGSSREGLIINKKYTPKSGYMQRRIIACMTNCRVDEAGMVLSESGVVQFAYGGDGSSPEAVVKCKLGRAELEEAAAQGVPEWATAALAAASPGGGDIALHLPVALDWVLMRAAGAGPVDAVEPVGYVERRLSELRPWQPSELTRAAALVKLRPSRRAALGLTGAALERALDRIALDWATSRAPAGMPAGIIVGTSLGPPVTQSYIDAFHSAGVATNTIGSTDSESNAIQWLLYASAPRAGTKGMLVRLAHPSEEGALALADRLTAVVLNTLLAAPPVAHATLEDCPPLARKLWAIRSVLTGIDAPAGGFITVPLSPQALAKTRVTAHTVARSLQARHRRPVEYWASDVSPFLLVGCSSAKQSASMAAGLAKHRTCVSGLPRVTSARAVCDVRGEWYVETVGTNLALVLQLPQVDAKRTRSRCTQDTCAVLGCEAACMTAYEELQRLLHGTYVNRRHLLLFGDFMVSSGRPLAFSRCGPLSRALYETPVPTLTEAALRGDRDTLQTLTSQIFVGNMLRVGSGASDVVVDVDAATLDGGGGSFKYRRT